MKNNNLDTPKAARAMQHHKAASTDILVNSDVVHQNQQRLAQRPRRKRRTNYIKKISNDPFLFNV